MHVSANRLEQVGRYTVAVDGVDVTYRCREADDEEGWAECYATMPPRIEPGESWPKLERLVGLVEIVDLFAAGVVRYASPEATA